MSIFVDGNLEAAAGIFFHIYRLTPQVALSAFAALAHGNEDDNRVLAYLMRQLFATDPLVANSIVLISSAILLWVGLGQASHWVACGPILFGAYSLLL